MTDVSVVTINHNNAAGLRRTITSVLSQGLRNVEYIVIDGGSSDGSREVIHEHSKHLAFWVSEPDRGVYHAMNKGIQRSTGTYLLFLNSGDYFNSADALERLVAGSDDKDIVYGDLVMDERHRRWTKVYPDLLTFDHFRTDSLPHPCSLIRRSLFDSTHPYDESLRIVSDWLFFMNAICLRHATYKHVGHPISVFTTDGLSSHPSNRSLVSRERDAALHKYYAAFLPDYQHADAHERALRSGWCRAGRQIDRIVHAARRTLRDSSTRRGGRT